MEHPAHKARSNFSAVYVRHRPEKTLLYQIVQEYWSEFQAELASHGRYLSAFVTKEFDGYLKCGRLEHGFLRVKCESCHDEKLVAFSCKKRGFCPSCGARRIHAANPAQRCDRRTDKNHLIFHTNMDAGHGGASGRYRQYLETAQEFAFLVDLAGLEK